MVCKARQSSISYITDPSTPTATFGPPSWHPSSQALLYTAEAPEPKTEGSSLPQQSSYKYTPDFGETFTGKKFPSIFLFLLPSSPFVGAVSSTEESSTKPSVHRLTSEEHFPTTSFGQSVFLPDHIDGTPRILATGYSRCVELRSRFFALSLALRQQAHFDLQ